MAHQATDALTISRVLQLKLLLVRNITIAVGETIPLSLLSPDLLNLRGAQAGLITTLTILTQTLPGAIARLQVLPIIGAKAHTHLPEAVVLVGMAAHVAVARIAAAEARVEAHGLATVGEGINIYV